MEFNFSQTEEINPLKLKAYVNKIVEIEVQGGKLYEGIVFTVDPICRCVVLISQEEDKEIPMCFPNDSINKMTIKDSTDEVQITKTELSLNLLDSGSTQTSADENGKRRRALIDWFHKSFIPITEDGDRLKMEQPYLVINPPYRLCDCVTDNLEVLSSIQNIMKAMDESHADYKNRGVSFPKH